jgi:FKBP-type peptidyl-prolyl cis-trans isomerase 2
MTGVKKGDKIKVEYVGKLEDGTVFDSSEKHDAPLEFTVGDGQIIKGFEEAVLGMKVGEEKEIKLPPEEGYGPHNPELVKDMPKDCFNSQDEEIKAGMVFLMDLPNGRQIPVRIANVTEEMVTIDLNPPLAGKTLIFQIKILDIAS